MKLKNLFDPLWAQIPKKHRFHTRMIIELVISVVLAIPDYVVIGAIPVVGDAWDVIGTIVLMIVFMNPIGLLMLAEFFPLVDLLPLELVPWSNKYIRKKGKKK